MRRVVAFLARLFAPRDVGPQRPRFVHRVTFTCPHSGQAVEADLLMGETGTLETMLRCSAQPACPPTCDQACRRSGELALAPVRALIICPPGAGPPEEID